MTFKEQIMKLQTYKMFEGEDTVYVERDDALKLLEQQPSEDCISREAVKQIGMNQYETDDYGRGFGDAICEVLDLPSVAPKPKKGKWIITYPDGARAFKCNQCKEYASIHHVTNYCPNCGAYMKEDSE